MMSKIVNRLNSINDFSKKIIIWSSIISLVLCTVGIGIIIYNVNTFSTLSLHTVGSSLIHASIVLFSQFVIGSLVIDFLSAIMNNNDDD